MTTISSDKSVTTRSERSRPATIALWVVQVLLALFLIGATSVPKFSGQHETVHQFAKIGWGQWLRYFTACCEVAGGIGLLIPRISGLAAIGLVGLMAGAVTFQLTVLGASGAILPAILLIAFAVIAKIHWSETKALLTSSGTRSHR
jgi:putative oxidoreductase